MASQKKISTIVFIALIIAATLIAFLQKKSLEKNFVLTSGYIYEFGNSRNSGETIFLKFKFLLNGIYYYGNSGFPCARKNKIEIQSWTNNKKIQLVYNKNNPNNCRLLITKEDYNKLGIPIPDGYKEEVELIDKICKGY